MYLPFVLGYKICSFAFKLLQMEQVLHNLRGSLGNGGGFLGARGEESVDGYKSQENGEGAAYMLYGKFELLPGRGHAGFHTRNQEQNKK